MRKLWVPLSLLLLVLLVCSWMHRDSFGQPQHYSIIQKKDGYTLKGMLHSTEAIRRLQAAFAVQGVMLDTKAAKTDALLESRGSLDLMEKIIPLFVSRCHAGSIRYEDSVVMLSGTVEQEEDKRAMAQLLAQSPVAVRESIEVVPPSWISFTITQQKRKQYALEGHFSSTTQTSRLQSLFQKYHTRLKRRSEEIDPSLTARNGIVDKLEPFLPFFFSRVREGELSYKEGRLSVKGRVIRKKEIETVERYLSGLGIETRNDVILDIKAIRGKRAKKRAKKLVEKLQRQRAKKVQIKKAEQEVSRDIVAMMDAPKGKPAEHISDNRKVRNNLRTLFETEIIEFNTAQTTLTPLGLGTVSKIAVILKAYPDVRIEIAGHTDSDGDDAFNMLLSQGRVNNVKRALMKEGIAKERIRAVGYGETKPLLPNTTQANKQKNRRVEIIVLGE